MASKPDPGQDRMEPHKVGPKPGYMESIGTVRTARRPRRCDTCGEQIDSGDEYVHHSLPPGSELGNDRWMTLNTCGWWTSDCRRYWEVDAKAATGDLVVLTA